MTNSSSPMGIYIHVPFCLHKCDYCDFYSVPLINSDIMEDYTGSVINELRRRSTELRQPFASIYLGGGTPSLLTVPQIERILTTVYKYYVPYGDPEISMEVNPATIMLQDMKDLRRAGINRLSIGVQSFANPELKILGRIHDSQEASEILGSVRKAGFDNFNLDLIYGLPGQTQSAWQANLQQALQFDPPHISAYLLQLEPSTPMARKVEMGKISLLDDEMEASLYYAGLDFLTSHGYQHYEISNFARTNYECRHNMLYWQGHNYLGIGAGAVSFNGRQRYMNQGSVENYIQTLAVSQSPQVVLLENMDERQKVADAIILGLRLTKGIKADGFKQRFGVNILREYANTINQCKLQGLLKQADDRIYLTKKAYFLSNQVFSQFIG